MKVRKHPSIKAPHGNSSVWRYMGLEKFLDLITNERLFFTNAAKMSDRFEATIPHRNLDAMRRRLQEKYEDAEEVEVQLGYEQFQIEGLKRLTLLNCWSLGDHESYALWKIYLSGAQAGVAVRSTVSRLRRAIEKGNDPFPEDLFIGEVEYSEFIKDPDLHRFRIITTKSPPYEYEREVRLFIVNYPRSEGGTKTPYAIDVGRHVKIATDELVERIYLSPFASPWFEDVFRAVLTHMAPNLVERVQASRIDDR